MTGVDRAILAALTAAGYEAYFDAEGTPDGAHCPHVVLSIVFGNPLTALRSQGGCLATEYQLRAVTHPRDDTSGDVLQAAMAALFAASLPAGVTLVPGTSYGAGQGGHYRLIDRDGFYNAVTTFTAYSPWEY